LLVGPIIIFSNWYKVVLENLFYLED